MATYYDSILANGTPVVTVSPTGMNGGGSTFTNNGADFGPDTQLGTTSPGV